MRSMCLYNAKRVKRFCKTIKWLWVKHWDHRVKCTNVTHLQIYDGEPMSNKSEIEWNLCLRLHGSYSLVCKQIHLHWWEFTTLSIKKAIGKKSQACMLYAVSMVWMGDTGPHVEYTVCTISVLVNLNKYSKYWPKRVVDRHSVFFFLFLFFSAPMEV